MTPDWINHACFYHIYPLGLCGAPQVNRYEESMIPRLDKLYPWLDHMQSMGVNALYLGPVFQSTSHGYDTVDYYHVDRRLGDNHTLRRFSDILHQRGMRLVLDAVFNHVGRDFWAFQDVLTHGEQSPYRDWFHNLRFGERSPKGDPFNYEGWHGHHSLVKLNLSHPNVRAHIFNAVAQWIELFNIDGLRLDAADSIEFDFLSALKDFTSRIRDDFWLMGEVVHGDYRQWANPTRLHAVTNYTCYKALHSSLNEGNYHEIAYELNRLFGPAGIYRELLLYNFVDNHDVDRVASKLKNPAWLYPLYLLLFTMPGIPSIYYGSEWGVEGAKEPWSDVPLRPSLELSQIAVQAPQPNLEESIQRLAALRQDSPALRLGDYCPVHVDHRQFAFLRQFEGETMLVVLNSALENVELTLTLPWQNAILSDHLNSEESFFIKDGKVTLPIPTNWGRVLSLRQ